MLIVIGSLAAAQDAALAALVVGAQVLATLRHFGLSSICNVLAGIATAKLLGLGPDDAVVTVATDGSAMYPSERHKILARDFGGGFTADFQIGLLINQQPQSIAQDLMIGDDHHADRSVLL